jgi:hypothetical protein
MAQAVSRRSLTAEAVFTLRSVYVRFVADEVALGQVLLRVFPFYHVSIVPPDFGIYHFICILQTLLN